MFSADDEVRIFIDGQEIATPRELEAGWVDISSLVRDGANEITAEVENRRGVWAYRWVLEAGGEKTTFECGRANRNGCTAGGLDPGEIGVHSAGSAWLYVHRETGEAKVQRE